MGRHDFQAVERREAQERVPAPPCLTRRGGGIGDAAAPMHKAEARDVAHLDAEERGFIGRLLAEGWSMARIARATGRSRPTLYNVLAGDARVQALRAERGAPLPKVAAAVAPAQYDDIDVEAAACRRMWCALLVDQLRLACGGADRAPSRRATGANQRARDDAARWLLGRDCRMVCDLIGLHHAALCARLRAGSINAADVALRVQVRASGTPGHRTNGTAISGAEVAG
ncbi:helix-turn-helix domain-containing protein [Oceaniglobus trochenteri]|uniref:helix-turn-helix domain-containing protein n=1 Tax=Oceaniglobus trochenteri TaxID=2763260 RepID=UPI001CFFC511|nr:helix-turn-helix domain-containing protein [Oceaniglobus trochenteri]